MTGMSNYASNATLNWKTGQIPMPSLPSVYLAMFTAVGTDAGTGFTEVTGGSYARVQIAGAIAAAGTWTTATPNITMGSSNPGWVVPGMTVYDVTAASAIGTVSSYSGTALTLTSNASHASSGSTDSLTFSAFPNASGTSPSSVVNGAAINFAQATANWGTVIAWGTYDASSSGNLIDWDFMGNFAWQPFTIPTASSLATVKAHGYSSNDPIVFNPEYGGTLPTTSTGVLTGYTVNYVASPSTDTFNIDTTSGPTTPIVTTASGSGNVRKITQQSIPQGVTASFAASTLTLTLA
ncbi:hypothetical protein [Bradyrhizobium sp. Tv2a-2]|uniref:phage tail fiber protein n=1 Tax=Bradyrhizobium sp. Tv2a-2 TaxID=113395 RepID=UPI0005620B78|nr:hypothetical protein [Bradyrhizobium sp. Tv2a-2]